MSSRTSRECPVNPLAGFHDSTLSNLHGAGMEQRAKGGLDEIPTKHRGSRPVVIHHFLYGRVWWRGGWSEQLQSGAACTNGGHLEGEHPFRRYRPHQWIREPERLGGNCLVRVWNRFVFDKPDKNRQPGNGGCNGAPGDQWNACLSFRWNE